MPDFPDELFETKIYVDKFSGSVVLETAFSAHRFRELEHIRRLAIGMLNEVNKVEHAMKPSTKNARKGRRIGKAYAKRAVSEVEEFLAERRNQDTDTDENK